MKNFWGIKISLDLPLLSGRSSIIFIQHLAFKNAKIRLTMLFLSGFKLYSRWVPLFEHVERLVQLTKLFNQSRFGSTMQLQSSLFSRGVLLGLHDSSMQSTVVFLIINFLTSHFCKRLSFFMCKFCQQALLVYPRLFMRSFRFSPPRGRRSFSSHARKNLCRRLPKCSAEEQLFRQLF